jgi:hypothetical protein
MKSVKSLKPIIFILLSVLIAVFAGCAGTALSPDEIKITNAIYGFFQAISDQDWDGARSYCVYESTAYNDVNDIEELWYSNSEETEEIDIEFIVEDIDAIIITGEYAEAYVCVNARILYNGEIVEDSPGEILFVYLQKIGDSWKLYNIEE